MSPTLPPPLCFLPLSAETGIKQRGEEDE